MFFNLFSNQKKEPEDSTKLCYRFLLASTPKSKSERLEKSCKLSDMANIAIIKMDEAFEFELYQQAILVCPENPVPYWQAVAFLHRKKRDEEAFGFFQKVKNLDYQVFSEILNNFENNQWLGDLMFGSPLDSLAMSKPEAVGMLVALGKLDIAKETLSSSMLFFWEDERRGIWSPWGRFMDGLPSAVSALPLDDSKKFIRILIEISMEKGLPESELQPCYDACIERMALGAFCLARVGKLPEALAIVEFALNAEVKSFRNTSRNELIALQETIHGEMKGAKKWDQVMSDDEFLNFLFKRLAFKFHPDLEKDEKERVKKTKIMQEINHAKDEKDMEKLEEIVRKYIPEWIKYLRKNN